MMPIIRDRGWVVLWKVCLTHYSPSRLMRDGVHRHVNGSTQVVFRTP